MCLAKCSIISPPWKQVLQFKTPSSIKVELKQTVSISELSSPIPQRDNRGLLYRLMMWVPKRWNNTSLVLSVFSCLCGQKTNPGTEDLCSPGPAWNMGDFTTDLFLSPLQSWPGEIDKSWNIKIFLMLQSWLIGAGQSKFLWNLGAGKRCLWDDRVTGLCVLVIQSTLSRLCLVFFLNCFFFYILNWLNEYSWKLTFILHLCKYSLYNQ